jgi:hypothetical protein
VSLIDLKGGLPNGNGFAIIFHELFGTAPVEFPVCDVPVSPECCFEPSNSTTTGARGRLLCPGGDLHGKTGTIIELQKLPNGAMIATVSYLGGVSRMPVCKEPPKECPPCEPPYFCCVNLETGRFVCPANPARHGKQAQIQEVIDLHGAPWVVLKDGQRVPACGIECPPPCPECPPCGPPPGPPSPDPCEPAPLIPQAPPGTNTPPGPPSPDPCEPLPTLPQAPPGTNTPPGPPSPDPCEPLPTLPQAPPGTNTPPGPAAPPICEPSPMLPQMPPGTNTPPGPPAPPICEPSPMLPSAPPGTNTPPGPPLPPCDPNDPSTWPNNRLPSFR